MIPKKTLQVLNPPWLFGRVSNTFGRMRRRDKYPMIPKGSIIPADKRQERSVAASKRWDWTCRAKWEEALFCNCREESPPFALLFVESKPEAGDVELLLLLLFEYSLLLFPPPSPNVADAPLAIPDDDEETGNAFLFLNAL